MTIPPTDEDLDYLPRLPQNLGVPLGCSGAGFIMADCHLPAYRSAGFNPVGIASRTFDTAKQVAERHAIPSVFETCFGTPHGLDLRPVAVALGAMHRRVGGGDLARGLEACLERPGVTVIELDTDRARNVELHRDAFAAVARTVEART